MAEQTKDAKAILTAAIKKRDELNVFIRMYQEMLGISDAAQDENGAAGPATKTNDRPIQGAEFDPSTVVYPGMFFGRSQPQAVRLLLEQVKASSNQARPVPTKILIECLEKGGLKVGGKKPAVNLWGVLSRGEDFILIPKAGWALSGWYDAATVARLRKQEPEKADDEKEETTE